MKKKPKRAKPGPKPRPAHLLREKMNIRVLPEIREQLDEMRGELSQGEFVSELVELAWKRWKSC